MDKPHSVPKGSPGYETRDANTRGVLSFLLYLSLILLATFLISWGMFRHFAAQRAELQPSSPFSGLRQLPASPQLQVNPRQDLLQFRAEQEKLLESYSWENRSAGTVRVPIERAMELLLQKGIPVAGEPSAETPEKATPKGTAKH
jgi:hypothetical protein